MIGPVPKSDELFSKRLREIPKNPITSFSDNQQNFFSKMYINHQNPPHKSCLILYQQNIVYYNFNFRFDDFSFSVIGN